MPYSHDDHRHMFSVWAAARAAQMMAPVTVRNLKDALESTNIRDYICNPTVVECSAAEYEKHHRIWCRSIIEFLSDNRKLDVTFAAILIMRIHVTGSNFSSSNPGCHL